MWQIVNKHGCASHHTERPKNNAPHAELSLAQGMLSQLWTKLDHLMKKAKDQDTGGTDVDKVKENIVPTLDDLTDEYILLHQNFW